MPKLLVQTELKIEWTDVAGRVTKEKLAPDTRSSGVHLSGIIRHCMGYDKRPPSSDDPDEMPLNMALGLAWEAWAVGLFPQVIWQPGEEVLDGVYGTPDGLSELLIDGQLQFVVEEWKSTYKSRRTHGVDILVETGWMWQLLGLCKLMGLRYSRLHVLWINGDYRHTGPAYVTYLIEFSQDEIDQFWSNIVLRNKSNAQPEIHERAKRDDETKED